MDHIIKFFPPIHREGYIFIGIFALLAFFSAMYSTFLGWVLFILTVWCIYFFRNPHRVVPVGDEFIVSPADGVVQKIEQCAPPEELNMGPELRTRISIFLNVFNVHVNRVPARGVITTLNYRPGKFFNASLDKASIYNERQSVRMTLEDGRDIVFIQIAGLIAKRIVCELDEGQVVQAGERFGLIRFGSRMDVYLPEGVNPLVVPGQTMIGGETILGNLTSNEETRQGEVR
jgi:phosphatidylserine decarboxylase